MARMDTTTPSPSRRSACFDLKVIAWCLAAAAVIIAAALWSHAWPRGSWQRIALALVEGIATAFAIVMPFRSLRRLDEMQQRIQLEALAFAFFGTGALGAGYGFLESAGLPRIDWGAVIWPAMV